MRNVNCGMQFLLSLSFVRLNKFGSVSVSRWEWFSTNRILWEKIQGIQRVGISIVSTRIPLEENFFTRGNSFPTLNSRSLLERIDVVTTDIEIVFLAKEQTQFLNITRLVGRPRVGEILAPPPPVPFVEEIRGNVTFDIKIYSRKSEARNFRRRSKSNICASRGDRKPRISACVCIFGHDDRQTAEISISWPIELFRFPVFRAALDFLLLLLLGDEITSDLAVAKVSSGIISTTPYFFPFSTVVRASILLVIEW